MVIEDIKKYFIFVIGGGLGLAIILLLTFILTEFFHIQHMISYSISLVPAILFVFIYHSLITFKGNKRNHKTLIKFVIIFGIMTFLNWILIYLFTEKYIFSSWRYYYMVIIFLATCIVSILNFLSNKIWVFKK